MSKGPGKWQRVILAELANKEAFYLRDLLPRTCTEAQYNAVLRAALKLEADRTINITQFGLGRNRNVVHRIGTIFSGQDRIEMDRRKCWVSSIPEPNNHLQETAGAGQEIL